MFISRLIGKRSLVLAGSALTMLLFSSVGRAAVLVNDSFQDGNRTDPGLTVYSENGTDLDADNELESAWIVNLNGGTSSTNVGHMVTSPASSMNWYTYFTPEATPVTLAAAGDSVKVTWKFTPNGTITTGNTQQRFQFGVGDAAAASRSLVDGISPGNGAYTGYAMFTNFQTTLGNGNPFQLRKRSSLGSAPWLNASGDWATILGNGATTGNHGYDAGTLYTLEWTLTRNASAGLDIDVKMSGGTLDADGIAQVTLTDPSPNSFTFDLFGVRPTDAATTATSFDTTLFKVETSSVPEPSSLGLFGLTGLILARRRRA